MATDANPPDRPEAPDRPAPSHPALDDDATRLAEIATRLCEATLDAVPAWIEGLVVTRLRQWAGHVSAELAAEAVTAGEAARDELAPRLRGLLAAEVEDQRTNPLQLLRETTHHAAAVLAGAGVPAMPRDQFEARSFPTDVYGLMPATWADVHPDLHELGLTWGAAKAYVFKARRRQQGFT